MRQIPSEKQCWSTSVWISEEGVIRKRYLIPTMALQEYGLGVNQFVNLKVADPVRSRKTGYAVGDVILGGFRLLVRFLRKKKQAGPMEGFIACPREFCSLR